MQKSNVEHGRLMIINLVGSERGAETNKACKTTRIEGTDINTSTGRFMTHIPFRGSKRTQVLKEIFVVGNLRIVMVA